jgi:hypothetical protein
MKSEVRPGHSTVDHLNEKFDTAERDGHIGRDRLEKVVAETSESMIDSINAVNAEVCWIDAKVIGFSPQYELDEAMAFLKRRHWGKVHDTGVVHVTASSVNSSEPKNVADIGVQSAFETRNNTSSESVQYDFNGMRIRPSHYTLLSAYKWGVNHYHPKNWVIEGPETGRESDWTEIDRQTNNADLNGADKGKSFVISRPLDRFNSLTQ